MRSDEKASNYLQTKISLFPHSDWPFKRYKINSFSKIAANAQLLASGQKITDHSVI